MKFEATHMVAAAAIASCMACTAPTQSPGNLNIIQGTGSTALASGGAIFSTSGGVLATGGAASGGVVANTTGGAAAPVTTDKIPCDVAALITAHCAECHGTTPLYGAPMNLMTAQAWQATAPTSGPRTVHEAAVERINSQSARMPPTSEPALAADALATLNTWLSAGAPADENGCQVAPFVDTTPPEPIVPGSSGGAHTSPITYDDPDLECYDFVAHASGDKNSPYSVSTTPDLYVNFPLVAPWTGDRYVRSIDIITDNAQVIHHWLIFKQPAGVLSEAVQTDALGTHPDGVLLYGWAPGATPLYMDPDVGFKIANGEDFLLEAHYNNATGAPAPDMSGARVCVTPQVPAHEVTLSWLGSDAISGTSATGTCTPGVPQEVHMIAAQPHMHLKGVHMKVVINRNGGTTEIIHDEDFSFENQRYYVLDSVLNPGETITTTCQYDSPASFGKGTNEEMCYFFTLHWPAMALVSTSASTLIHGSNSCM